MDESKQTYDMLARAYDFFDAEESVQRKYEMLRVHSIDGVTITESAKRFGYTRKTFYECKERFEKGGILGLMDRKKGPKKPRKVTPHIDKRIFELRAKNLSITEIADIMKSEGISISFKTVERRLKTDPAYKKNAGKAKR